MSEIDDEGLLPPNVHHARPEKPEQSDEDADRERAAEGAEEDGTRREEDPNEDARRHPHAASARRRGPEESDDPYAKPGEDPYGKDTAPMTDRPDGADDPGRVDGETDADGVGAGAPRGHGTGEAGTGEPPD
ncbi:hypothetical protein ACTJI8_15315 [Microbacterium sp. 22303]|uniref:hypothetical protein n=1 Tax=Microbacterium sp. 22303 TaxID=3453905 RepID=UPI003F8280AF